MCSIIGSFSKERLHNLAGLNAYRGSHSHSVYAITQDSIDYSHRGYGLLNVPDHSVSHSDGRYFVAHQQAPTTADMTHMHPAQIGDDLLWHNGIIKEDEIERLQQMFGCKAKWDTYLLLKYIVHNENVNNIDGTFSCVMRLKNEWFIFRNEISPMFISDTGDISSTKFAGSTSIPPNIIFKMKILVDSIELIPYDEFVTVENPYYFA